MEIIIDITPDGYVMALTREAKPPVTILIATRDKLFEFLNDHLAGLIEVFL